MLPALADDPTLTTWEVLEKRDELLGRLGDQGWELIAMTLEERFDFKRPLSNEAVPPGIARRQSGHR